MRVRPGGGCYVDVGNDGCFDAGIDTIGVQTAMVAGHFRTADVASGAGLVCPPSVKKLTALGGGVVWFIAGDASFYGTRIEVPHDDPGPWWDLSIFTSGTSLLQDVRIVGAPGARFVSSTTGPGGSFVSGRMQIPACTDCLLGLGAINLNGAEGAPLTIGAGTRIVAGEIVLFADGGDPPTGPAGALVFEEGVKLHQLDAGEFVYLESTGIGPATIFATDLSIRAVGRIWITGTLSFGGRTWLRAKARPPASPIIDAFILLHGGGEVERISSRATGSTRIVGSLVIGPPAASPGARSSLRSLDPGSAILIESGGSIDLEGVTLAAPRIVLDQRGDTLTLRNSRLKGRGQGATAEIRTGDGSACDLTGTKIRGTVLTEDCGSVIGP